MTILPAIDLQGGRCVRLLKGKFDDVTDYGGDPVELAHRFESYGFDRLHVVDLDGARTGDPANSEFVRSLLRQTPLEIQLGGGIRDSETVSRWFDIGVERCVIGSAVVENPGLLEELRAWWPTDRIVIALDVKFDDDGIPQIKTQGWTEDSGHNLWQCLDEFDSRSFFRVLCTDISRDGALSGPNIELYRSIVARYPNIKLQASGGVRSIEDIREAAATGATEVITGRALLDGLISGEEIEQFRQSA